MIGHRVQWFIRCDGCFAEEDYDGVWAPGDWLGPVHVQSGPHYCPKCIAAKKESGSTFGELRSTEEK